MQLLLVLFTVLVLSGEATAGISSDPTPSGGGGSGDGVILDGNGVGQADVMSSAPIGSEEALIVRPIPSGTQAITGDIAGTTAHDTTATGNPVQSGCRSNAVEPVDTLANGNISFVWCDRKGAIVTHVGHPPAVASTTHGPSTANLTTTSDVALVAAPGTGLSVYVTFVSCTNIHATDGVNVLLKDGTAAKFILGAASARGGFVQPFVPHWKITANTAFNAALSAAVTSVDCNTQFYIAP